MKSEINVALGSLQAVIDNRVLLNAVDINGKFNINPVSNDIFLKNQRVDGSLLYDALELSFNMADKTSVFKISNVDSLESLNLRAFASKVFTKQ